jgi:hypothetical protein
MIWAGALEEQLSKATGEPSAKEYREQFRKLIEAVKRGKGYFKELNAQNAEPELERLLEVKVKTTQVKNPFEAGKVPRPPVPAPIKSTVKEVEQKRKLSNQFSNPFSSVPKEDTTPQEEPVKQVIEQETKKEEELIMEFTIKREVKQSDTKDTQEVIKEHITIKETNKTEPSILDDALETTRKDIKDSIERLLQEEQEFISHSVLSNPSDMGDEPFEIESNQAPSSIMKQPNTELQNMFTSCYDESVGPSMSVATIMSQYADIDSLQAAYQRKKEELADCEQKILASEGELTYCKD